MTAAEERMRHFLTEDFPGRFVSQHVINTGSAQYIADFCSKRDKLIIEVDGESHRGRKNYDNDRQAALQGLGFTVLRFKNTDVIDRVGYVLNIIRKYL